MLISTSAATVSGPLVAALALAATASTQLAAAAASTGDGGVIGAVATITASTANALSAASALGVSLTAARDTLSTSLCLSTSSTCSVDVTTSQSYISYSVNGILGGGAFFAFFHGLFLCRSRGAAGLFRLTTPIMLFIGVLTPLLGAAFYAVALVGSDFCVSPSTALSAVVNASSPLAGQTLAYAAACGAATTVEPSAASAQGQAAAGVSIIANTIGQIASLNASISSNALFVSLLAPLGDLTYSLASANVSAVALATGVACAPTATIYFELVNGLCTGAASSGVKTLFAIGGAVVAVTGVLFASIRACWQHPGDEPDGDSLSNDSHMSLPRTHVSDSERTSLSKSRRDRGGEYGGSGASDWSPGVSKRRESKKFQATGGQGGADDWGTTSNDGSNGGGGSKGRKSSPRIERYEY